MSEIAFSFPRDLEQTTEYRRLAAGRWPEGPASPLLVVLLLFRQMSYVPAGGRVGHLPRRDAALLAADCGLDEPALLAALVDAGLLAPDREGDGWECAMFLRLNRHLDPTATPVPERNARLRHHNARVARAEAGAMAGASQLPLDLWRRPDGSEMDAETVRRVRVAVIALDSGLRQPDRPLTAEAWPASLVHGALAAIESDGADRVLAVARGLLAFRDHPAIPRTTEQLLARWGEAVRLISSKK